MKTLNKNKKGFTLIEIIVVLVIMGILLAIAIPAILGYVGQAKDAQYLAEARGGYLAAQTITAKKAAKGEAAAGNQILATDMNTELGLLSTADDGFITGGWCSTTNAGKSVDECHITVDGLAADKHVQFKGKTATVEKTALPAVPAP